MLVGTHILSEHCLLENRSNEIVQLKPFGGALCYVNGKKIDDIVELKSGDRVIFGKSHVFRFNNPEKARKENMKMAASPVDSPPAQQQWLNDSSLYNEGCVDFINATQELKEKQGIDIKQEMERKFFSSLFYSFIFVAAFI